MNGKQRPHPARFDGPLNCGPSVICSDTLAGKGDFESNVYYRLGGDANDEFVAAYLEELWGARFDLKGLALFCGCAFWNRTGRKPNPGTGYSAP